MTPATFLRRFTFLLNGFKGMEYGGTLLILVLQRRHPILLLEYPAKVRQVLEAAIKCDITNTFASGFE